VTTHDSGVGACDPAELQAAFRAGWKVAAKWANRDDLTADIGSPAYLKDMADALAPMLAAGVEASDKGVTEGGA
jgi:hypothetical protein